MSNPLITATYLPFVPQQDAWEFQELREKVKEKARRLHAVAELVAAAPKNRRTATYLECAGQMGVAFNTLYRPVSAFIKSGDWRHLIDRTLAGSQFWLTAHPTSYPDDFVQYWKWLVEDNQRCAKTAYGKLMDRLGRWRAGDTTAAIPGYLLPPDNAPKCKHPRKMSYRDLLRIQPGDLELVAARNGRAAAMKHLPQIFTTRKGGWAGMEYQFDDMWHDFEVVHNMQLCRLLEFSAVEFYSGYIFNPGLKPRIKNEAGKNETLNERDFRLWAIHFLATVGWSPRGTTLQGERGTAAFRALAPKLIHWSNGLLKIPLPGMSGESAHIGGWRERAKGNPNAKALKEGMGKIIHNRLASLPGQVGMNPQDKPSASFGRDKEALQLIALQQHLSQPLSMTHLTFEQAALEVVKEYMSINRRSDHDMEGWIEEQLFTQEYCADPHNDIWIDVGKLPDIQRQALAIIASANPDSLRPRRLSPAEVLTPHLPHNIRLSPEAEADCLYEDARRTKSVTSGHLAFEDKDIGPGVFRYIAEYQDRNGFRRSLANDTEVQIVVNSFNPDRGFLFTPKGSYLGVVLRDFSVQRADRDAIHRRIGEKERRYKDAMLAANVRHGLKRETTLTANARILLDSLGQPQPAAPKAAAYDLSSEYAAAEIDCQPQPQPAGAPSTYSLL